MKEFWKSVKVWQSYRYAFGGPVFLEHSVDRLFNIMFPVEVSRHREKCWLIVARWQQ